MNRSPGWPNLLGLVDPDPDNPDDLRTALGHPPGWAVFQRCLFNDATVYGGDDWAGLSDAGTAIICCLEWEPGSGGTVPGLEHLSVFASRCREYVQGTRGCHIWVVGDEPNRSSQWPGATADPRPDTEGTLEVLPPRYLPDRYGQLPGHVASTTADGARPITPEHYAECLKKVGAAIRSLPDHEEDLILCAAVAPWNTDFRNSENPSGDWIGYFEAVCAGLGTDDLQGFALHTATSGSELGEITTEERLAFPFAARRRGFRAYLDFVHAIPPRLHHLPVFITEVSQLEPWANIDTGWTTTACTDIQAHNRTRIQNPVRCAALYTWNRESPWTLREKPLVTADIARSIAALEVRRHQDALLPVAWSRVEVPARKEPDQALKATLAFENAGLATLAASGDTPARLSCMLGSTDPVSGNCVIEADHRIPLPGDIDPGEECEVSLELPPPAETAQLTLYIGIIPAGFLWSAAVVEDAIQVPLRLVSEEPEEETEPSEPAAAESKAIATETPDEPPAPAPAAEPGEPADESPDRAVEPPPTTELAESEPETDRALPDPAGQDTAADDEPAEAPKPAAEPAPPPVEPPPAVIDLSAFFGRPLGASAERSLADVTRVVFVESRFDGDPPISEVGSHFTQQGYEQVPVHFLLPEPNRAYQIHKAEHNPIPYAANLSPAVVLSLPRVQGHTHGWLSRFDALADTVFQALATVFDDHPPLELEVGVDTLDGDVAFKSGAGEHLEDICLLLSSRWADDMDSPVPLKFVPVELPLEGSPPETQAPSTAKTGPDTALPDTDTMPRERPAPPPVPESSAVETPPHALPAALPKPDASPPAVPAEPPAPDGKPLLKFDDESGFVALERDAARWLNIRFSHLQATSICLWVSGEDGTLPLAQFRRIHRLAAPDMYFHYVVEPTGRILDTARPGTARENLPHRYRDAIHVCLRGRGPHPQRNMEQLEACSGLLAELLHCPAIAARRQAIGGELPDVLLIGSSRWQHGPAWTDAATTRANAFIENREPADLRDESAREVPSHPSNSMSDGVAVSDPGNQAFPDRAPSTPGTGPGTSIVDAPAIIDRVGTIPQHPVLDFPRRQRSSIRRIVVHHSGFPSHVSPHDMAESLILDQLAMDGTEPGLPYHFVVRIDGTVEQIHDLAVACHSTHDDHDSFVAVCLAGTFSQGINPTPLQLEQAGHLIAWLLQTCYLSEADVAGHQDVDPFEDLCPGEEWNAGRNWSQTLRYHVSRHLAGNPVEAGLVA